MAPPPSARVDRAGGRLLTPPGKVVHATGEARDRSTLENLRAAAVAIDRARGGLRRKDNEDALQMWRVLVDGEWSLVDRFDIDQRRYLVVHRNPPALRDPRALTIRERQVATYTAMGHSAKLIAYELGISASAVSVARAAAMRKLGVSSLAELVQFIKQLAMSSS